MTSFRKSPYSIVPVGTHTQSDVDGVSTLTRPGTATGLIIQNITPTGTATASIRYTMDGVTAASSTVGFLLEPGDSELRIDTIKNLSIFMESGGIVAYQWFNRL